MGAFPSHTVAVECIIKAVTEAAGAGSAKNRGTSGSAADSVIGTAVNAIPFLCDVKQA